MGLTEDFLRFAIPSVDWDDDQHLQRTPQRFQQMLADLTTPDPYEFTVFDNTEDIHDMVVVQDVPFHALCKHHIVPFVGKAHVAYVPDVYIAGLSKFARAIKSLSRGLWVQETLTDTIAEFLVDNLAPMGLGIVMQAEHMCMTMRGVQSPGTITTTSAMRGVFLDPEKRAREEFLALIRRV